MYDESLLCLVLEAVPGWVEAALGPGCAKDVLGPGRADVLGIGPGRADDVLGVGPGRADDVLGVGPGRTEDEQDGGVVPSIAKISSSGFCVSSSIFKFMVGCFLSKCRFKFVMEALKLSFCPHISQCAFLFSLSNNVK